MRIKLIVRAFLIIAFILAAAMLGSGTALAQSGGGDLDGDGLYEDLDDDGDADFEDAVELAFLYSGEVDRYDFDGDGDLDFDDATELAFQNADTLDGDSTGETTSANVRIPETTVDPSASSGSVDIIADLPNGVNTMNLTVSIADSSVAEIEGVNDEADFGGGFQASAGPSTAATTTFRAADLISTVSSGSDVTLFSVDLTSLEAGTSSAIH